MENLKTFGNCDTQTSKFATNLFSLTVGQSLLIVSAIEEIKLYIKN